MLENILNEILSNLVLYITAFTTIGGVLVVIYKKAASPLVRLIKDYSEVNRKLDTILVELSPNGGTSIKDIINRIDKAICLSSERQRAILADSANAIFEADETGNFVWVNRTYMRLTHRSFFELTGTGWINSVSKKDRQRIMDAWALSIAQQREFSEDLDLELPNGDYIPVSVNTYIMKDPQRNILGYIGIITKKGE